MVDARLPERYLMDRRLNRLSDADFRGYAMSLLWSVATRTDGVIEPDDLALIPKFRGDPKAYVEAGLWLPLGRGKGWRIADFDGTQTSKDDLEVLENVRAAERRKKARQRAEKAARETADPTFGPGDRPGGHVPGDSTGRQDRQEGQESSGAAEGLADPRTGEVEWPTVRVPGSSDGTEAWPPSSGDEWSETAPGEWAEPGAVPATSSRRAS